MNSQVEVLVDSTFLLPTLGVKVTQISDCAYKLTKPESVSNNMGTRKHVE